MLLLPVWNQFLVGRTFIHPGVSRVSNDGQQPGSSISSVEPVKSLESAQVGFLNDILRVLIVLNNPTCKIIGSVQARQKDLFELSPFVSHYCSEPSDL